MKLHKLKYKDFHINQKPPLDEESEEYDKYWKLQKELCLHGFLIDGVHFPGFLYWHINFWGTALSVIDEYGDIVEDYNKPVLRDNEWIITNELEAAKRERKGLLLVGCRRLAKSTTVSSYIAYGATLDPHSQNVFVGVNGDDIQVTTGAIEKGLTHLPPYFQWNRNKEDWRREVALGIKKKDGSKINFSQILIRNLDNGKNEEAIAGTKPRKLVIEEAGKSSWLKGFKAATPGFTTPHGWGCVPFVIATSGDMDNYHDVKEAFWKPSTHKFMSYKDPVKNREHALFLGNKYRQEAKVPSTLGDYLGIENKKSELYKIPMLVSDEEKANAILDADLELLWKSSDKTLYYKEQMYFPKTVDDLFLNTNKNIFNTTIAKSQKSWLEDNNLTGTPIELSFNRDGKIEHKISNKQIITEFPLETQSGDAPIVVYEFPVPDPPFFLYVGGVDPYRFDDSERGTSLGTIYIYKRIHSLTGEGYQETLVASFTARPEKKRDWEEQARLLIMWYNAYTLVENDEPSFIEYMKTMKCERYLASPPRVQKTAVLESTLKREFGVSRSNPKIINLMHGVLKTYMEETINRKMAEDGTVLSETLGVSRILDPMLLEEVINFGPDVNVDRIVAAECALVLANELDPLLGSHSNSKSQDRLSALRKVLSGKSSTFSNVKTTWSLRK